MTTSLHFVDHAETITSSLPFRLGVRIHRFATNSDRGGGWHSEALINLTITSRANADESQRASGRVSRAATGALSMLSHMG